MPHELRPLRLLQVTLIVRDLESTLREFEEALGLRVAFRDPGVASWGLENAVLPLGSTFIELLSPTRPDTPGGRHLERQGGDGGYMVILQVDRLDAWRAPLAEAGVRIVFEAETADTDAVHGASWAGFHLHPGDTGGMMISLDRPDPPDSWAGAGPDWRDFVVQDVVDHLEGIELRSAEPDRLASRWAGLLGRDLGPGRRLTLDRGAIAFTSAAADESEGLAAVHLHASDRSRVGQRLLLGGVPFVLG